MRVAPPAESVKQASQPLQMPQTRASPPSLARVDRSRSHVPPSPGAPPESPPAMKETPPPPPNELRKVPSTSARRKDATVLRSADRASFRRARQRAHPSEECAAG